MNNKKMILVEIISIKPFGIIVKPENRKSSLIMERDISDYFIPDLSQRFVVGEKIFVVEEKNSTNEKPAFSYKKCHSHEHRQDPLFKRLLLETERELKNVSNAKN